MKNTMCSDPFNEACDPLAQKLADLRWRGLLTDDEVLEFTHNHPHQEEFS